MPGDSISLYIVMKFFADVFPVRCMADVLRLDNGTCGPTDKVLDGEAVGNFVCWILGHQSELCNKL